MFEPKHADLWRERVDEACEDEIDRAVNVSVAQAEAELAAAGFDVAAERAKAGAFLETVETGNGDLGTQSHSNGQGPSATEPSTTPVSERGRAPRA